MALGRGLKAWLDEEFPAAAGKDASADRFENAVTGGGRRRPIPFWHLSCVKGCCGNCSCPDYLDYSNCKVGKNFEVELKSGDPNQAGVRGCRPF